jgi:predicted ribosome quality control (RQC) complex YloA/Tae2 family protein
LLLAGFTFAGSVFHTGNMNDRILTEIVNELIPVLTGTELGKVYQLSATSVVLDFQPFKGKYLFLDVAPSPAPRLYLTDRRLRELEKQSVAPSPFTVLLRNQFTRAVLRSINKDETDRIVRFRFDARDEVTGRTLSRMLIAQLTGQSANLFALDEKASILASLRHTKGEGQQPGDRYAEPVNHGFSRPSEPPFVRAEFATWSDAADAFYRQGEAERRFAERAARIRSRFKREIGHREKLRLRLELDLENHGDANEHKHIGDLLLANLSTATRTGSIVRMVDYFSPDAPEIDIEVDQNMTLQDAAAARFARYGKAKRAAAEIAARLKVLEAELASLREREAESIAAIATGDPIELAKFEPSTLSPIARTSSGKAEVKVPGVRRYLSTDGYEILVGRGARDNDHLTFKVAKPNDLWLHAADYPGSHVVIRNRSRAELPQRTIIEAAQLAANYSQAKTDKKVNINYTQRKFLSKPKGSAQGLVRLSQFRTLIVEPRESGTKL